MFNVLGKELATLIPQNFPSEVTELSGMQMASQVDDSTVEWSVLLPLTNSRIAATKKMILLR